jgi:hypothetical protein
MEKWKDGHGDMTMYCRHEDMDMETWRHRDTDIETWSHGHGDMKF